MTKLLISDITRMRRGFCVIGLEHKGYVLRSIRPLPPTGNAWRRFPYKRGDVLQFLLSALPTAVPHVEDSASTGIMGKTSQLPEGDLVGYLRRAEVAENARGLFACHVHENVRGSGIFVEPNLASRSICGCEVQNIRFQLFPEAIRATLLLPSGETLRDLPVVDRDWVGFIRRVSRKIAGANRLQRANRFLNGRMMERLFTDTNQFARIGLTRLHNNRHWLMLDSLFPSPQITWLDGLP